MNLVWETNEGEGGRGCFDRRCWRVGGAGQKFLFAFLFLVLLKEMRKRGQSKISSCCFGLNQDNSPILQGREAAIIKLKSYE